MNQTKKLTEGAMMCALIGVLLFINRQSAGFIDYILYWVVPLPIVLYTVKYGLKDAVAVAISASALAFVSGMPTGLYYTIVGCIVGLLYGGAVRNDREHHELLMISCGISAISGVLTTIVFASFFGYNLAEEMAYINEVMNETMASMGLQVAESLIDFIPKMYIFVTVLSGVIEGLLIHILSYIVLTRFKMKIRKMKPINTIQLPKWLGLILTFAYCGANFMLASGSTTISADILYSIMVIAMVIFMGNGYLCALTVIAYYKKRSMSWFLMFAFFPPFSYILLLLGVFDSLQNIRNEWTVLRNR